MIRAVLSLSLSTKRANPGCDCALSRGTSRVGRRSPREGRNTLASCKLNARNARAVGLPSPSLRASPSTTTDNPPRVGPITAFAKEAFLDEPRREPQIDDQSLRHHLPFGQRNHVWAQSRVAVTLRNRRVGPGLAGRDR